MPRNQRGDLARARRFGLRCVLSGGLFLPPEVTPTSLGYVDQKWDASKQDGLDGQKRKFNVDSICQKELRSPCGIDSSHRDFETELREQRTTNTFSPWFIDFLPFGYCICRLRLLRSLWHPRGVRQPSARIPSSRPDPSPSSRRRRERKACSAPSARPKCSPRRRRRDRKSVV